MEMRNSLFYCLLVTVTTASAEYAWKAGMQYSYNVRGRTVTGLNQVTNQFTGVLMRAKLIIQAKSGSTLSLKVKTAEYTEIHANLSNGWDMEILDELLNYRKLPLNDEPFELYVDDGIIKEMTVNKNVPTWAINILKSIVSLLQVDTQAENIKDSRLNLVPDSDMGFGVYKTMEDSINGIYETIYSVSQLQEYILQSKPELLPLPHLRGNGKVFEIIKSRNFSNSNQHLVYNFGLDGQTNWKPGSNQMGNFLSRTSVSQIIISGNLKHYTIQSSVTNEKIIVAPHLYNKKKGMVGSRLNLTIESVSSIKQPIPVVSNPKRIKNLVYEYNTVNDAANTVGDAAKENMEGVMFSEEILPLKIMKKHKFLQSPSSDERGYEYSQESYPLRKSNLSESPHTNFFPFYVHEKSEELLAKQINSIQNVIRLAREIGQGVMTPNTLTGEHTLQKFITLARIIRTLSAQKLKEISDKLYYPYSKAKKSNSIENALKYQSWLSFRDAIGEAGSGPALITIREWIVSKIITGEEAYTILRSLPNSARQPTIEYLNYFFEMLNDEVVKNHILIRMSATLSFTDLVRKAVVDRRTAHNYYPIYMYGPLTKQNDRTVIEKYIPYLQKQLQEAVEENNSINIQLNIRALNNIAHPLIFTVFKPYLEGKITISKFQRLTIIASMDKIVKLHPKLARTVLYRIYQNIADTPEIRVAAVIQLMKTNPPVEMIQQMAQRTNYDHSKQVNAAVKSAVESVARQTTNEYNREMVDNARAAVDLLTSENFGGQYSRNFINSYIVKEQNLAYKHHLASIHSADNIFPNSLFYSLKLNIGGYKHDINEIQFMTSSMSKLFNQLYGEFVGLKEKHNKNNKDKSKLSFENIFDTHNFEKQDEELEGNFLFSMLGEKWYFAFNNSTLQNIPNVIAEIGTNLMSNNRLNFTKMYNQYSLEIVFPTAMGFPFFYSLETPILVDVGLWMKENVPPKQHGSRIPNNDALNVTAHYHFVYSILKYGKMGFITPYDDKMYVAGLEKNVYINIPSKTQVELNLRDSTVDAILEPFHEKKEQKIFEYSTVAFTSMQDSHNTNPLLDSKKTQLVHNAPLKTVQQTFGQEKTGFSFDLKLETDRKHLDFNYLFEKIKAHDSVSFASYVDMLDDISNQNYTISYNPKNSWSKIVKLSVAYDKIDYIKKNMSFDKHNRRSFEEKENFATLLSENSETYQQQLVKNVAYGINNAQAHLIKLQITFEGQYKTEYELNLACADSYISNISRILALVRSSTTSPLKPKLYSVALQVTSTMPDTSFVNYRDVLNGIPSKIVGRVDFGEEVPFNRHIIVEGVLNSSEEQRNYLQKHPNTIMCEKQIQDGYKFQPACRHIITKLNYFDNYHFKINYQNIPKESENIARIFYKYFNNLFYDYSTKNMNSKRNEGMIDVDIKFGKDYLYSNLSIVASDFSYKVENVPIHEWIRPLAAIHPRHNIFQRLSQTFLSAQQSRTCTINKDRIITFDGSNYYITLGNKEHVLSQYIPDNHDNDEYFNITVQIHPPMFLELKIVTGKDDVLKILPYPTEPLVVYNGEQIIVSSSVTELRNSNKTVIFKLIAVSQGTIKITAEKHEFEIIYYGNHTLIKTSNKFISKLKGLCGNFDAKAFNDWDCNVKGKILSKESFDTSTKNLAIVTDQKLFNAACQKQTFSFGNIVDEEEVKQYYHRKTKLNNIEKMKKKWFLKEKITSNGSYY